MNIPGMDTVQYEAIRATLGRLDSSGLSYMITGSMAMNYYAEPRSTRDIDIVIDLEVGDERGICKLFSSGFYFDEDTVRVAIAQKRMFNVADLTSLFKFDFIVRKGTPFEHTKFVRRCRVQFLDLETWMVSKEDLILSKMQWAQESLSEKQIIDIRNLIQTGCDLHYINGWVKTLRLDHVLAEVNS